MPTPYLLNCTVCGWSCRVHGSYTDALDERDAHYRQCEDANVEMRP